MQGVSLKEKYNILISIFGKDFPEFVLKALFIIMGYNLFNKMASNWDYSTMDS